MPFTGVLGYVAGQFVGAGFSFVIFLTLPGLDKHFLFIFFFSSPLGEEEKKKINKKWVFVKLVRIGRLNIKRHQMTSNDINHFQNESSKIVVGHTPREFPLVTEF